MGLEDIFHCDFSLTFIMLIPFIKSMIGQCYAKHDAHYFCVRNKAKKLKTKK